LSSASSSEAHLQKKVLIATERLRPDVVKRREELVVLQAKLDPDRLVFLDETWANTNMSRTRGRSLKGTRLVAHVPHGHWKTTTFVAALRTTGLTAPLVVDGAINGTVILAYVRQQLIPALKRGDILILDNLAAHKVAGIREAIEDIGARICYLPPYIPDFNPIETAFSKFKSLLRSAAERRVESLWTTCGKLIDKFSETECRNHISTLRLPLHLIGKRSRTTVVLN
jgi:transposase